VRKALWQILVIILVAALFSGCATSVRRVRAGKTTDLSGRWNDTDSGKVAKTMVRSLLGGNWILKYRISEGNRPVIIIGEIENRTSEHIDTDIFIKNIERELIESGRVKFVANPNERTGIREERQDQQENASRRTRAELRKETGADVMLIGSVKSQIDQDGKDQVRYYQVDLELIEIESNEKIWLDTHSIKKLVERAAFSF
jgi:penicillin-binding protein activator